MTIPVSIDSEVVGDGRVVDRSLVELILHLDGNNHDDSNNDDEEMEGGLTQDNNIDLPRTVQGQALNEKNSQLLPFGNLEAYPSTSGGSGVLKRSASSLSQKRNSSSPVCGSTTETSPRDHLRLEVQLKKTNLSMREQLKIQKFVFVSRHKWRQRADYLINVFVH
ncbi:hypothetical protein OUZ56_016493 [Daphnia magna]|uniref:Uncharacterized protein n=1 Tax=Daphnia magna TaxID=35525 RepID=A0ABR0AQR3_9CRUS|nr:hypothetical protein OUZ56_016493 [Daphnia magna]